MAALTRITLNGYKSIKRMSLELGPLNVLIGPNGAGKSNLVSFFRLLNEMMAGRLRTFVTKSGGANFMLFRGAKTTSSLEATLVFTSDAAESEYSAKLDYGAGDTLFFSEERIAHRQRRKDALPTTQVLGAGHRETQLHEAIKSRGIFDGSEEIAIVALKLDKFRAFHFHDTSAESSVRQGGDIHNDRFLRHDGGNLAAVLYRLQRTQPAAYWRIVKTVCQIAPWFGDFVLEPEELNENVILLRWREHETDMVFGPHAISDGALRAIALFTLLLQPEKDLPSLIVIDEPELGLHPHALVVLAALLRQASRHCQVIVATQSTFLLDQFEPEDVIVVDREARESEFRRLERTKLREWLEEYSMAELWEKNVLGGGPA
jgi:predicted ATPase